MTYSALENFKALFLTSDDSYYSDGVRIKTVPTMSDYSAHLNGERRISVSGRNCRFAVARLTGGSIPADSPLVRLEKDGEAFASLFLGECIKNPFEHLHRIADIVGAELSAEPVSGLPFFGARTDYAPLDDDGKRVEFFDSALEYLMSRVTSIGDITEWEKSLEYNDAPPCIQTYYIQNGKLPDFAFPYLEARKLPVESGRVRELCGAETFPYKCGHKFCRGEECASRKYGIKSAFIPDVHLGELTQYSADPVFYVWKINGEEIRFDYEYEIIRQDRFIVMCMRKLGVLPRKLDNTRWLEIVNKAISHMRVVGESDATPLTIDVVRDLIISRMRDRVLVSSYYEYERIMQGFIYLDPASATFVVEPQSLCSYITGRFRDIRIDGISEFHSILRHLGFKGKKRMLDGTNKSLWYVRTRFMFRTEEEWKNYMLDISAGTVWEDNFRAFLTDDDTEKAGLDTATKEQINSDALVFIDTERNAVEKNKEENYGR